MSTSNVAREINRAKLIQQRSCALNIKILFYIGYCINIPFMGRVRISCCDDGYWNNKTKGGQSGTWSCSICACAYGWRDIGDGQTRTWLVRSCPKHGHGDNRQTIVCGRCNGKGSFWNQDAYAYIQCPNCMGTGYVKV